MKDSMRDEELVHYACGDTLVDMVGQGESNSRAEIPIPDDNAELYSELLEGPLSDSKQAS